MFDEDLDVYFNTSEHGVAVSDGVNSTVGILDKVDNLDAGGQILSTEYKLIFKTGAITATNGSSLTVASVSYKVRYSGLDSGDGKISYALLSKV
jgi:hypothetical protein